VDFRFKFGLKFHEELNLEKVLNHGLVEGTKNTTSKEGPYFCHGAPDGFFFSPPPYIHYVHIFLFSLFSHF
jgi:hypothetical protein